MRGSVEMTSVLASRTFDQFHLHYIWFYCLSKQVQKDRIKKKNLYPLFGGQRDFDRLAIVGSYLTR